MANNGHTIYLVETSSFNGFRPRVVCYKKHPVSPDSEKGPFATEGAAIDAWERSQVEQIKRTAAALRAGAPQQKGQQT